MEIFWTFIHSVFRLLIDRCWAKLTWLNPITQNCMWMHGSQQPAYKNLILTMTRTIKTIKIRCNIEFEPTLLIKMIYAKCKNHFFYSLDFETKWQKFGLMHQGRCLKQLFMYKYNVRNNERRFQHLNYRPRHQDHLF